jgi:hypothetical protein
MGDAARDGLLELDELQLDDLDSGFTSMLASSLLIQ